MVAFLHMSGEVLAIERDRVPAHMNQDVSTRFGGDAHGMTAVHQRLHRAVRRGVKHSLGGLHGEAVSQDLSGKHRIAYGLKGYYRTGQRTE